MSNTNTFAISDLHADLVTSHSNLFEVSGGNITDVKTMATHGDGPILALSGMSKSAALEQIVTILGTLGKVSQEQVNFFGTGYGTIVEKRNAIMSCLLSGNFDGLKDMSSAGLDGDNRRAFESPAELPYANGATNGLEALTVHFGDWTVGDYATLPKNSQGNFADMVKLLLNGNVYTWRVIHEKVLESGDFGSQEFGIAYNQSKAWDNAQRNGASKRTITLDGVSYGWSKTAMGGQLDKDQLRGPKVNRKARIIFEIPNTDGGTSVMAVNLAGPAQGTISRVS